MTWPASATFSTECGRIRATIPRTIPRSTIGCAWRKCWNAVCSTDFFLADVLGAYDVYGGNADAALRGSVQIPLLDPMALVPAMAYATAHLGFGVTCNLAYEAPFLFARRMASLDHLTRGRIGWNIVTGYLDSAARARWASLRGWNMTTATIRRTNICRSSTRCGRVVGRTTL